MRLSRFAWFAWAVLGYNVLVVLWGAYVRATGSGAGCGSHWPLCQGVIIPRAPQTETIVEFTHRLSSGLVLILAIILLVWAWRAFAKGSQVRLGAMLTMILTGTEALLGAGLVLFGLVARDQSVARAASVGLHLVNTFLLLAALALTAWWASGGRPIRLRGQGMTAWVLGLGLLGALALGMSGAITALGDTLFPASSLAQGLQADFSSTAHFLIRLRVYHPILAVSIAVYLLVAGNLIQAARPDPTSRRLLRALTAAIVLQLLAGAFNVVLLAPVWMQLLHLLLADMVWILLVLLSVSFLAEPVGSPVQVDLPQQPAYAGR